MAPKPTKLKPNPCVRMMVYGLPGAGKTRLLGTGEATLIVRPPTDHTDSIDLPADAEEVEVSDWNEMLDVYMWLQQGGGEYKWVWLDSITLFQEFGLDDVYQAAVDRKPQRAEFGPDKGEYGINMTRLSKWVRDMVGLSKAGQFNLGVTAHVMEVHDPVLDTEVWAPNIQGKNMSPKVCGYMNIVAYIQEQRSDKHRGTRLLVTDAEGFWGKDQYGAFPELKSGRHGFVNPTMADIDAAIEASRKPTRKRSGTRRRRTK